MQAAPRTMAVSAGAEQRVLRQSLLYCNEKDMESKKHVPSVASSVFCNEPSPNSRRKPIRSAYSRGGEENIETITHPQAHQCSRRESRRLSFVSSDAASSTTDSPLSGLFVSPFIQTTKTEYYYYIRIIIIARGSACIMQDTQPGPGRGRDNRLPLACGGRCGWRKANSDPINALTKVIPMPVSGQPRPCLRLSLAISTITRSGRA